MPAPGPSSGVAPRPVLLLVADQMSEPAQGQ
jgi:hypothetical protein